jgi:hypothetical protein
MSYIISAITKVLSKLGEDGEEVLTVRATSTSSERCFSQAKLFTLLLRNRLLAEALKESMLLSSWYKTVDQNEHVHLIKTNFVNRKLGLGLDMHRFNKEP